MLSLAQRTHATHIRAGNILTQRLSDVKYSFTLIVYTNRPAVDAGVDDPTATLNFGDGTSSEQPRASKRLIRNDTYENIYYFEHIYPGTGTYKVGYTESNRNGSIKNISNSINTPFYIESLVSVVSGVSVLNNSPQMAIPPLDKAQKGKLYVYNPGAYDIEGDSISYRLVVPKQAAGVDVSGYFTPDNMTLNSITGDLVWNVPQEEGLFNVAFYVEEWRNGQRIGYITRDMQIEVLPSRNEPPKLSKGLDTCIVAGDTLIFNIEATDPDVNPDQDVRITSTNLPLNNPPAGVYRLGATFTNPPPFGKNPKGVFEWATKCEYARNQPHQVEFKAVDYPTDTTFQLADYQTLRIKIIAKAPNLQTVVPEGKGLRLTWENYNCSTASRIRIYRKSCDTTDYKQDPCQVGSEGFPGYTLLAEVPATQTTYLDNNKIARGNFYCYVIVAVFQLPQGGLSKGSDEVCGSLEDNAALLASINVDITDTSAGKNTIKWFKPLNLSSGSYSYKIFRATGINGTDYVEIGQPSDTVFVDEPLNTADTSYSYRVDVLFSDTIPSDPASTLFLQTTPGDRKVMVSWTMNVPWNIDSLKLYRKAEGESLFSLYKTLPGNISGTFTDDNLVNCDTFCYYIESYGSYCNSQYPKPLISTSESKCEIPIDDQIPPPPFLTIISQDCKDKVLVNRNLLNWTRVGDPLCNNIDHYNIYFAQYEDDELGFFKSVPDTTYIDMNTISLSGCYTVSAVNIFGVEGLQSNRVCVDNCVFYGLPNLITPNSDGFNDEVVPLDTPRYVEKVKFSVYNRWGALVHTQDNDINIHWNGGTNKDGIYYYVAEVKYVRRLRKKDELQNIKSWLHILR
ncbi:hypothetical protein MYP_1450 [Sporocytophaga myxococcoides]|uniref:Fibronectin type-III domain-containing protein n=2 Tax=Sporocytophaga myxococcoides TaxID=153721 RepID=A0A098LCK8_9BACT|nr:hypothetical protein MYP_1450 [Sporocytophaga myxococcoides]